MNLIYSLVGIIVALIGAFFFQKNKKDSAEALLQNNDVKNQLNQSNQEISKNNGLLEAEKIMRQRLDEQLAAQKKESEKMSNEDLLERIKRLNIDGGNK